MLSSVNVRLQNIHLSRVEIVLILILLLFGIPMIVLIPPGAGYDEEDHLIRVWELSAFSLIPGQMSPQQMQYPVLFRDFAYRQQGSAGVLGADFWERYGRASFHEYGFVRRELNTKSVYSPVLLLPQALTMHLLGRRAGLPALPVFYASRAASLLSYLLLVWLAIRWIPFGKWILLVLAVTPMALFQATTLSPDAISNGIGFLFIAGCLQMAQCKEIGGKEWWLLVVLIALLFLAKLNLVPLILLPFLLIPPIRFRQKKMYLLLLAATIVLFLVETVGWYIIAAARSDPLMANDADAVAQVRYLLSQPLAFPRVVLKDLLANGWLYVESWINGYGYYYWTPPRIVLALFLLSLVAVLIYDSPHEHVDRKKQIVFLFVFVMGYLATAGAEYTTFTPVAHEEIYGMQGRYFVPLALLLFLTLASFAWLRKAAVSFAWMPVFLVTALIFNTAGLYLSFHVPCGSTFYETRLCYRPLVKDFSSETHASPPLSKSTELDQEVQVTCDGLAELRVMLIPSAAGDRGSTRFVLQEAVSARTLLDHSIGNDQITREDWYSLPFEPDWASAGKQYLLTISNAGTPDGQGLKFLFSPQSDFDRGTLYQNGEPSEEDLVLQYGCATGLRKIWLTGGFQKP